ncbi:MAG: AmmeMemoRadiSam system protein B [Ruminiclostridium sp.]|nr:AmmeMemoRadiSam system protein B [Ruminiclostridium sp.]
MKARNAAAFLLAGMFMCGCSADTDAPAMTGSVAAEVPEPEATAVTGGYTPRSGLLKCLYYEDERFQLYDENSTVYDTGSAVLCGVAPHHLAAGHFIAGMYRTAAETDPDIETVVLLAPMHYDSENTLTTSMKGWDTVFGTVECDTEVTELFRSEAGAVCDDYMTEYDHSASSHIPFISRYLPGAKAACLLVSPKESRDIPQRLSKLLYEISRTKKCFFAFSIDFSHYLDPDKAEARDAETLPAVLNGDTAAIERFTNANVDTPYCLSTFVRLSELLGARITKADHSNTYRVGSVPYYSRALFPEGVTSYFVFLSSRSADFPAVSIRFPGISYQFGKRFIQSVRFDRL